jgi:hypothetical protein
VNTFTALHITRGPDDQRPPANQPAARGLSCTRGMRAIFLLGSGISVDAGMPITDRVRADDSAWLGPGRLHPRLHTHRTFDKEQVRRFATDCNRLQPRGSKKAPSSVVRVGYAPPEPAARLATSRREPPRRRIAASQLLRIGPLPSRIARQ